MRLVSVKGGHLCQIGYFRIYPDLCVSSSFQLVKQFPVVSLPAFHKRSEKDTLAAFIVADYEIHYLVIRISDHFIACGRGVCLRCTGIQKPQEIIDFGDGADSGTGVVAGGFLFYRYYRAQSRDAFHFRLAENADELLGIGRKGVHIPSLAFCIYGVKSQRGLSAAAQPGDDHELVPRDVYGYILEIVRFRTPDFYVFRLSFTFHYGLLLWFRAGAFSHPPGCLLPGD